METVITCMIILGPEWFAKTFFNVFISEQQFINELCRHGLIVLY